MDEHTAITYGELSRRIGIDRLRETVERVSRLSVEGTVEISDAGAVVILDARGRDVLAPVVDSMIGRRVAVVVTLLPE